MKKNFQKRNRQNSPASAPFADLAMIVLIFFVLLSASPDEHGLEMRLSTKFHGICDIGFRRNVFNIYLSNSILADDEQIEFEELKILAKQFIVNYDKNPSFSESPQDAIISLKTSRNTDYVFFIKVLNELQTAYTELRAESVNLSVEKFQKLAKNDSLYQQAVEQIPMLISEAEPDKF